MFDTLSTWLNAVDVRAPLFFNAFGALALSALGMKLYWWWITGRLAPLFKQKPPHSIPHLNRNIRSAWIAALQNNKGSDILAVQTLRNAIMVSTALASATLLALLGVFTLLAQHDVVLQILARLNASNPTIGRLLEAKLATLAALQLFACYSFLTAIRYYGHASFLVTIPAVMRHLGEPDSDRDVLPYYLQRAGDAYSIGLRLFLFNVPMFAWLLGNSALLFTTTLLLLVMYWTDRY